MAERRYVTSAEAARALDIGRTTLWRWQSKGEITPAWTTPKGHARWDLDDLRRQLRHEEPPVPEPATTPERPPVVAAVVTSKIGVLVSRRVDGKPPWGFISGEIEPGESPTDAAVREVKEETGLRVRGGRQEIGRRIHPKTGRTMIYLACTPLDDHLDVFVGDEDELAEVRWVPSVAALTELMPRALIYPPVLEHLARMVD